MTIAGHYARDQLQSDKGHPASRYTKAPLAIASSAFAGGVVNIRTSLAPYFSFTVTGTSADSSAAVTRMVAWPGVASLGTVATNWNAPLTAVASPR